jgi:hypothetical protein
MTDVDRGGPTPPELRRSLPVGSEEVQASIRREYQNEYGPGVGAAYYDFKLVQRLIHSGVKGLDAMHSRYADIFGEKFVAALTSSRADIDDLDHIGAGKLLGRFLGESLDNPLEIEAKAIDRLKSY